MSKQAFWFRAVLGVVGVSILGAALSKKVAQGTLPWYATVLLGPLAGLVWGWMASQKDVSLVYASIVYDVATTLTYVVYFSVLGERLTPLQWLGVVLSVFGTALASGR